MSSADPLSFFAGEDSSSSESEGEEDKGPGDEDSSGKPSSSNANKLPSPDSLFATVKTPSFLTDPSKKDINWDHFVKKDEPNVHLSEGGENYAAIAPPKDLGEHNRKVHTSLSAAIVRTYSNTGGEISAPPIRYSTNDVDAKFRTVSDGVDLASGGAADPRPVRGCDQTREGAGRERGRKGETRRSKRLKTFVRRRKESATWGRRLAAKVTLKRRREF